MGEYWGLEAAGVESVLGSGSIASTQLQHLLHPPPPPQPDIIILHLSNQTPNPPNSTQSQQPFAAGLIQHGCQLAVTTFSGSTQNDSHDNHRGLDWILHLHRGNGVRRLSSSNKYLSNSANKASCRGRGGHLQGQVRQRLLSASHMVVKVPSTEAGSTSHKDEVGAGEGAGAGAC
ncbi:hypothetical protein WJX82_001442 [Trebouxia sp. C0006]